jgi:YVTN family beta-propeller protein
LIDAEARTKISDIRVGKVPQGMAVTRDGSQLLVANFGSNTISIVDTAARKELTQIAVGRGPLDVITTCGERQERAWITCFNEGAVSVVALDRCKEIQRIVTGGKPQGVDTHPSGERVYVAVRERNELIVINTLPPHCVLRRISMPGGPARMAIMPEAHARKDIPFR